MDTNLKGTFNAVKAVLPVMRKNKYGRIVVTATLFSNESISVNQPYFLAKFQKSKDTRFSFSRQAEIWLSFTAFYIST